MNDIQRTFIVGDKWLYYKIYTGPKTSELILSKVIKQISERLLKQNVIDKWFFVRYNDPEYHLRVRFHCQIFENISEVIHELRLALDKYVLNDLVYDVQIGTYKRELERYGIKTIEKFEELFFQDSVMIAKYLAQVDEINLENKRWLFGAIAVDRILDLFGYSLKDKCEIIEKLKTSFGREFEFNRSLKKQMEYKYQINKCLLKKNVTQNQQYRLENEDFNNLLLGYEINAEKIIDSLLLNTENTDLEVKVKSYLHMMLNRLFRSKNRLQEFTLYYLLYKHYLTQVNLIRFVR